MKIKKRLFFKVGYIFLVCLAVSIMSFSFINLYSNDCETTLNEDIEYEFFDEDISENLPNMAASSPNGKPLVVNQYANISRTFSNVRSNENISFPIASGWTSKNVTILYEDVCRQKQWTTNSHFTDNANYWNYIENDPNYRFFEGGHVDWDVGGRVGSVWLGMDGSTYYGGEYAGFQQGFTISGESLSSDIAVASVDYYFDRYSGYPDASIFLDISIGGVLRQITIDLDDITMNQWETLSIAYNPTTYGQTLPGAVSISAGISMNGYSSNSLQDRLYLDNIKLTLWTKLPNSLGLVKAYDVASDTNYTYYNTGIGQGYSFSSTERTTPGNVIFTIYENISPSLDFIDFKIKNIDIISPAIKVFNTSYFGQIGSYFTLGTKITWKTTFSNFIPTYYSSWLEIQKPVDWSFTSIKDGFEIEQVNYTIGNNYGSSKLIIPNSIMGDGTWDLEAESYNKIIESSLAVWNSTHFVNQNKMTFRDVFHFDVTLNGTVSLPSSEINCTIFHPNDTLFLHESKVPVSYNVQFGDYSVGKNMTTGNYRVELTWRNDQSSIGVVHVGFAELSFNLWHHTNLTALNPQNEQIAGDPLLLKVRFLNTDINETISSATVAFNSTYGLSGVMGYQGFGIYIAEIDTSILELGDYYFSFNTSKPFYENRSYNNLIHLKIEAQPLSIVVPHSSIEVMSNSIASCQVNITGSISGIPLWPVNISTDWKNPYNITDHSNGTYTLEFSTESIPVNGIIESYTISIFANKTNYVEATNFITLIVHPIQTGIIVNKSLYSINHNNVFYTNVNFTEVGSENLIIGANITVEWDSVYEINFNLNGYVIKFYTSGLTIGEFSPLIKAEKPGYETAFKSLNVLIIAQNVNLTIELNSTVIEENSLVELYFKEQINITARVFAQVDEIYLSGSQIRWISDHFEQELIESPATYYNSMFNLDGAFFNPGLNTIYIEFQQENYSTTIFSFQIFIYPQSINISVYMNSQNIQENALIESSFNDIINLSCRVFVDVEYVYLSSGNMTFVNYPNEIGIFESVGTWFNLSILISVSDFSLGLNHVYLRFDHDNYSTTTFSFQILVNQINFDVEPVNFADTFDVYVGETANIEIELRDEKTGAPILNANVSYTWEYGVGSLIEVENGTYLLELSLPDMLLGNYRVDLIISKEGILYKTTQYSFIISISEKEVSTTWIWILILGATLIIGVLAALSLRAYVFLPRSRRKQSELLAQTQDFKDIRNIQAIMLIHKTSGINLYSKTFSILKDKDPSLFSGFIQALTIVGEQMSKDNQNGNGNGQNKSGKQKDLIEIDFKSFFTLIHDYKALRVVFLLSERSSEFLKNQVRALTLAIYNEVGDKLEVFTGTLNPYKKIIPGILNGYFNFSYKSCFRITSDHKYFKKVMNSREMTTIHRRLINVIISYLNHNDQFDLDTIFDLISEKDDNLLILAVKQLIQKKVIVPIG